MNYLCNQGHVFKTQHGADNCGKCKAAERKRHNRRPLSVDRYVLPKLEGSAMSVLVIEDRSTQEETRVYGPFKLRAIAIEAMLKWARKKENRDWFDDEALDEAMESGYLASRRWELTVRPLEAMP
jgi:hypothetical protein